MANLKKNNSLHFFTISSTLWWYSQHLDFVIQNRLKTNCASQLVLDNNENPSYYIIGFYLGISVHRRVLRQEVFRFSRSHSRYFKFSVVHKLSLVLLTKLLIPNCHISINNHQSITHQNHLHLFRRKIRVLRRKEQQGTLQISRHAVTLRQISIPMIIYWDSKCTSIMGWNPCQYMDVILITMQQL